MKKITATILFFAISLCMSACAAEPRIEWLDIENVTDAYRLDEERLEIVVNDGVSALCAPDGTPLTEFEFANIRRISENLYYASSKNVFKAEKPLHALDKNGKVIESFVPEPLSLMMIPGQQTKVNLTAFEEKGVRFYYACGHYVIAYDGDRNVVLANFNGDVINDSDCKYDDAQCSNPYLVGKIMLTGDEHNYALIADPYLKRYIDKVDIRSLTAYPASVVFLNENNKYAVAEYETLEIKDGEYDEFICITDRQFSFKKDGLTYVTDEYGNVVYSGDKEVRMAAYGSYVVEENGKYGIYDKEFNEIFPCEYEAVSIVAKDLYILKKNGKYTLSGQGRELISNKDSMQKLTNYIAVGNELYDVEGNLIVVQEGFTKGFYTNYNYTFFSKEKQRIGKLVYENPNPIVEVNGKYLYTDTLPRIENDEVLVPLRALAECIGFEVSYDNEMNSTKLKKAGKEIIFDAGKKTMVSDGGKTIIKTTYETVNNRILVPLETMSDVFGFDIEWEQNRKIINIITR